MVVYVLIKWFPNFEIIEISKTFKTLADKRESFGAMKEYFYIEQKEVTE